MRHQYITGFQWRSDACVNCHPTGWEAAILPADHSLKYFPIQSGSHDTLLDTPVTTRLRFRGRSSFVVPLAVQGQSPATAKLSYQLGADAVAFF